MADAWLWETGDRITLEDGSGVWILETQSGGGGIVSVPDRVFDAPAILPLPLLIDF